MLVRSDEFLDFLTKPKPLSLDETKKCANSLPKMISVKGKHFNIEWKVSKETKIFGYIKIKTTDMKTKAPMDILLSFYLPVLQKSFMLDLGISTDPKSKEKDFKKYYKSLDTKILLKKESYKDYKEIGNKITKVMRDEITEILGIISGLKYQVVQQENYVFDLNYVKEAEKEDTGVIRKVGNKWKILKKNRKDYWNAEYDTKADAQAALRAYWANKKECYNKHESLCLEGFTFGSGIELIKNLGNYLRSIFGPTLYFDHISDDSVDLYYKGEEKAELLYNDRTEEVIIMPEDGSLAPVSFYDTSEYEIKDYLSDLILGDLNPSFA